MKKLFVILALVVVVAALVLGGCAQPAPTPAPTPAPEAKTLKVGVIAWLGWSLGVDYVNMATVYTDLINKKGGLDIGGEKYKIELLVNDSKFAGDVAKAAAEKLVYEDKVNFILGDETVDAWLPVTEQNKVVVIVGTPAPAVLSPNNKYAFQGTAITCQMQETLGWYAQNYPDKKTVVFSAPDFLPGHLEGDKIEKTAQVFNLKIIDKNFYPMQASDVSALGTKIKTLNPDIVVFDAGGPEKEALNWKATYEAGYRGVFMAPYESQTGSLLQAGCPAEALEGYVGGMWTIESESPSPVAKEFLDAYIAEYGKWNYPDPLFSNNIYLLVAGLQQAQSTDPEKVAEVISKGIKFDSTCGPTMTVSRPDLGNTRACDVVMGLAIKRVEGGKNKLLHQLSLDEAFQLNKLYYGWK